MSYLTALLRLFWIGLCALAMLSATRLLLGLPLGPGHLDGMVFGATVFGYYWTLAVRWKRYLAWGMGLLAFVCFWFLDDGIKIAALVPAFTWATYYGWRRPGNSGLRKNAHFKPHVIAFTWAWVTVLLALPPGLWAKAVFLFAGRAGFIFALALAYDLHDCAYDKEHGLETFANRRSAHVVMRWMDAALLSTGLFAALNYYIHIISLTSIYALLFSLFCNAVLLKLFFRYAVFMPWRKMLIDGLMILHWLVLVAFTFFVSDF